MKINKKRVVNVKRYIQHLSEGSKIIIGLENPQRLSLKLEQVGFTNPLQSGQTILPAGTFGPVSLFNAEGRAVARKDLPMETAYREAEWHWTQWKGRYDSEEMSKIVDVPYKRYPRDFVSPPSIEFTICTAPTGTLLLISPEIIVKNENEPIIKHTINLFLEIFGECELLRADLKNIISTTTVRLNWEILPQGKMPWEQVKHRIEPLIKNAPKGLQPVLEHRFGVINGLNPDFRAVGRGGFHGYVIHGFTDKKLYILESMYYGNATYVFDETWEELSKRTKAEILNGNLQKDRIVHLDGWDKRVNNLVENVRG